MPRLRTSWPIVCTVVMATVGAGRPAVAQVPIVSPAFEPLPRGSAAIAGTVVAAEDYLPLRRAAMTLTLLSAAPGRDGSQASIVVLTDERGRYAFRQLPSGRYNLTASKTSRVTVAWGQRRPADGGTALDVADGQVTENIDFSLSKSGVLVVHVTNDGGDPIAGVGLEVFAFKYVKGQRVPALVPGVRGATNAAGERRLSGLGTGDYFVRATTDPRSGTTVRVPSGQFFVITPPGAVASILNAPASNIGPSFYPGTPLLSEAQRVHVTAGAETAIAFPIGPRVQPRIRGTVSRSDGASAQGATIQVKASGAGESLRAPIVVQADGTFSSGPIAPDDYTLLVFSRPGTPEAQHAIVPVRLGVTDISELAIATTTAGAVHGRIVFDEGEPPAPLKPWDVEMVALGPYNEATNRTMHADWTFDFTGLEGPVTLTLASGSATGWLLKSVTINDQNVLDWLVDVDGRNAPDAVVTLTRRMGTITGTVTASAQGTVLANCPIVVFPEDPRRWTPFSRSIITAATDAQGRFTITGLLPGRYFAAAATDLEAGAERDADALAAIARSAASVEVVAGESASIVLPVR